MYIESAHNFQRETISSLQPPQTSRAPQQPAQSQPSAQKPAPQTTQPVQTTAPQITQPVQPIAPAPPKAESVVEQVETSTSPQNDAKVQALQAEIDDLKTKLDTLRLGK